MARGLLLWAFLAAGLGRGCSAAESCTQGGEEPCSGGAAQGGGRSRAPAAPPGHFLSSLPLAAPAPAPAPVSFGPSGGAPKDCTGYMKGNEVDWSGGLATVTHYNSGSPGGGAFGMNFGDDKKNSAGFYGAAYPNPAMSSADEPNFAGAKFGLCKDGIVADTGVMPHTKDGQNLCFKLKNPKTGWSIKVQVTENCGGNCFKSPAMDCNHAQECNTIFDRASLKAGISLKKSSRCASHQECTWPKNFTLNYNDGMTSSQSCKRTWQDWCSGVYAHFDIGIGQNNPDYTKLCKGGDNCIVTKERVACTSS